MIKTISIKDVRGINCLFDLQKLNIFYGENASGKSTILNLIREIYKGSTTIREGITLISDDNGLELQSINGILPNKEFKLGNDMELMTPGFFLNGIKIEGINKTKEDKRSTIAKILGINIDEFFLDNQIDYNIKGLSSTLRDLKLKATTYTTQVIESENNISNLIEIHKPKKIELIIGNEESINNYKNKLLLLENNIKKIDKLKIIPDEIELIQDITNKGNEEQLEKLQLEINSIIDKGKIIKNQIEDTKLRTVTDTCPTCKQKIKDYIEIKKTINQEYKNKIKELNEMKQLMTTKFKEKKKEINNFTLIKDHTILGNIKLYKENLNGIHTIKEYNKTIKDNIQNNKKISIEIIKIKKELKLIKIIPNNIDKYNDYIILSKLYDSYISDKLIYKNIVSNLTDKIKKLDIKSIENKIQKYQSVEKQFVEYIKNKLKTKDFEIIFYTQLVSPNVKGDLYKSDFNIKYKGKLYNECSGGEQAIIDVLIAKMFIDYYKIVDFILIDSSEISTKNLKRLSIDYLKDLQIITTRINVGSLKIKHKF